MVGKVNGPSGWLSKSRMTHGESTDSRSVPKAKNNSSGKKPSQNKGGPGKVAGNSSGGGSVKQNTSTPGNGTTKYTDGIMNKKF